VDYRAALGAHNFKIVVANDPGDKSVGTGGLPLAPESYIGEGIQGRVFLIRGLACKIMPDQPS
jgi:hypothetical protein